MPLVLWLFTRAPLGLMPSLGLGVLLMASHRLYARPFALARAGRRCLYCAGSVDTGVPLEVVDPLGPVRWAACSPTHAEAMGAVLGWAWPRAALLRVGIVGTLLLFLVLAACAGIGWVPAWVYPDAVALFRLGVALSVLPLGWLSPREPAAPADRLRSPFPLHVPALIGTRAVLWLFRLVGLWWLVQALLHVAQRAGALG